MDGFDCRRRYAFVRGFNFHGDWAADGISMWQQFNAARYRELIRRGKRYFPGINTLRIWLSFSSWIANPTNYLKNVRDAGRIISEEELYLIPTYLNGCFGVPNFDGFTPETLFGQKKYTDYRFFKRYLRETAGALAEANVLVHDIANEPFNNVGLDRSRIDIVIDFLQTMAETLMKGDARPITVGSQGFPWLVKDDVANGSEWLDIDLLAPFIDVVSLHAYRVPPKTPEAYLTELLSVCKHINELRKDVIVTECCWFADTDEQRAEMIRVECEALRKVGLNSMPHAMCESPVFDLHPVSDATDGSGVGGAYMAFIQKDGQVRPYHDIYRSFC